MKTKLIAVLASIIAIFGITVTSLVAPITPTAYAINTICDSTDVAPEVKQAAGCKDANPTDRALPDVVQAIINGIILILGIVAVVFVVIGGVGYMTSNGDASKLQKSKNTILYACIGLVICVLSFAITNFTINLVNDSSNSTSSSESASDDSSTPCVTVDASGKVVPC